MGRILDARGDEALDILVELLGPVGDIASDPEISDMMQADENGKSATVRELAVAVLKRHRQEIIEIMAIDDGKTVEEERGLMTALTIPKRLVQLLAVPSVRELLFGQAAGTGTPATGSSAASSSGNG